MPPPEVRNDINMWRRVYRAYDNAIAPHITIIYPFIPIHIWDSSRRLISDATQGIHPFVVTLRELGTFVRDESVLWLKPEDGKNIIRIRTKMQQLFPRHIPQTSLHYVPHLTIGLFGSVEKLLQARAKVQKQLKPTKFTVDRIIYAMFEHDGWRIHDHISLQ
jgi:2'-5' RNA ligase